MIQQRSFVEVGHVRIAVSNRTAFESVEHVVDVAGLRRVGAQPIVQLVGFAKVLVVAMSARDIAVMMDHAIPEELSRTLDRSRRRSVRSALASPTSLGICVLACLPGRISSPWASGSRIALWWKRRERARYRCVSRVGIEIRQSLVDATMLGNQHLLHLCLVSDRQGCRPASRPSRVTPAVLSRCRTGDRRRASPANSLCSV